MKLSTKILLALLSVFFLAGCQVTSFFKRGENGMKESAVKPGEAAVLDVILQEQQAKEVAKEEEPMPEEQVAVQATLKTNLGDIVLKFYPEIAPKTVANFTKLALENFYDGTKFHRVIKDFMIQGGDPLSKDSNQKELWGTGGPGYAFEDEINEIKLVKGKLAMANAGANTNGSQFFIVTAESTPWLDGAHTVFGEVIAGMDVVEKIENTKTDDRNRPIQDVIINNIETILQTTEEATTTDEIIKEDLNDANKASEAEEVPLLNN